jgi:hypothetical protein
MEVIMNRSVFATIACVVALVGSAAAQAKPASQAPAAKAAPTTSTPAPATPAKFPKIIKGSATVDVYSAPSKKIGNEMVTVMKIRNTSGGAIAGFKVEEYWYDKKPKPENVTGDVEIYKKPIQPGEIVEITLKSPLKPGIELYQSKYQFTHANGAIEPTRVKKM